MQKNDLIERIAVRFKRAKIYRNDQKRLNVHTVVHHDVIKNKYDLSSNYNVLIEKNKHP